jgi:hypothetical protein
MGPEMLPLQVTCIGELMETEKLDVSIKKSFLKGDALVKIPLVRFILRETGSFLPNTVNRG